MHGARSAPSPSGLLTWRRKANKERLGVLLAEVQNKTDNSERYRLALDGKTRGTSSGSTRGVYRGHE